MVKRSAEVPADILDAIYDCAVDPDAWARLPTVLARMAEAQTCAVYYDTGAAVGDMATHNLTEASPDYVTYYHQLDPWMRLGRAAPQLASKFGEELIRQSVFEETEYYRDFGRNWGLHHLLGVHAPLTSDLCFNVGLHRPHDAEPFSPEIKAKFDLLLPHIQRALQLRLRAMDSERHAAVGFAGLSALSFAVIICDGNAIVEFANPAAEQMATGGSGLKIARRNEGATLQLAARTQELYSLVRNAASGGAGGAMRFEHAGETLLILVAPLPNNYGLAATFGSRVMVSIKGTARDGRLSKARLSALFDFTATESELAVALMSSKSIEEIAAERGVKMPTLRTQLASMFAKTGTDNQRDLVRLLGTIPQVQGDS
jgi:DNA-binding CsgD family transcriptional regulator